MCGCLFRLLLAIPAGLVAAMSLALTLLADRSPKKKAQAHQTVKVFRARMLRRN
jgi:hypothetical protein